MSRRRNTGRHGQAETTLCLWCESVPTRDGAYICEDDLDAFVTALHELQSRSSARAAQIGDVRYSTVTAAPWCPWPADEIGPLVVESTTQVEWCPWPRPSEIIPGLWDDLLTYVSGERGVDYRTLGGGGAGSGERGVVETGIVLPERAAEIAEQVVRSLRGLVVVCRDARVQHIAPEGQAVKSTGLVDAMVEWLLWRVDGVALHPEAAQHAQHVFDAIEAARWVIDRPETRQQLGDCPVVDCGGHLTALPDATFAWCDAQGHAVEAQPLRDHLLDDLLDDRLCTASEIARLSTYLRLRQDRDTVRRTVNLWGHRGRIAVRDYDTPTDAQGDPVPPYAGPFCRSTTWCGHTSCPTVRDSRGAPLYLFGEVYDLLLAANPTDEDDLTDSKGA